MEVGFATAQGLIGGGTASAQQPRLLFVVAGSATSANPVEAFKQGLSGAEENRPYRVSGVRCTRCGFLELYANGEPNG
jgi:hypothetical protein